MSSSTTRPDRIELGLHFFVFALAAIVLTLRSHGAYNDDDLDHFFIAAASLKKPEFLVDYWGRAGFTTLYALPAQFGWTATRLFTLLLVLVTGFITARTASKLGARHPAVWAALAIWQPLVLLLSFSVLTEPLAALLIAIVLNRQANDRPFEAALAAGLLPTVRLELGVISILVGAWILMRHRRSWPLIPLMALPLALWTIIGGAVHGNPSWLLNEIRGAERPLRTAGPVHYLRNLIVVTGPVIFLGLGLGAWNLARRGLIRPHFAGLTWIVVFSLLTLLTWDKLKFGASIGFLRHLIVLSPVAALLAGAGFERALGDTNRRDRWIVTGITIGITALVALVLSHRLQYDFIVIPGHDWRRLMTLAPAAALLLIIPWLPKGRSKALSVLPVIAAIGCLAITRPIDLNREQRVVRQSVEFMKSKGLLDRPLFVSHTWFYLFAGLDRWDRTRAPYTQKAAIAKAAPGSIIVWENHYSWRLYGDIMLPDLRNDPAWRLIREFEGDDRRFRVVLFERVGAAPAPR